MSISNKITFLRTTLPAEVELVAVSKTYPSSAIREAYDAGQRVFGENRPQELVQKQSELPSDIEWHYIGHLQTNKVKYIAPFVSLIHSADSSRLLSTINAEAIKNGRVIDVLLEVHVAQEQSKHGWEYEDLIRWIESGEYLTMNGIRIRGIMGMATYTDDKTLITSEFRKLKEIFDLLKSRFFSDCDKSNDRSACDNTFNILSMGMSGDYEIAIECGSNMVRIGSYIFGSRT